MTLIETVGLVLDALEAEQMSYMLSGSLASIQYGIVRSTKDADIVVDFAGHSIQGLMKHLDSRFVLDRQITFETVTGTTRYIVDVPEIPFRIEFFQLSSDPHDQARFGRRRQIRLAQLARSVWIPTREDVVVTKLNWAARTARGKDRDDVRDVIMVQGAEAFDWEYIHRWCAAHGTRQLLDEILQELPEIPPELESES